MTEWHISVDSGRCIGAGLCAATAPDHFRVVGGRSEPVAELAAPDVAVAEAAELCPVEAVTVRDVATQEVLAPSPEP